MEELTLNCYCCGGSFAREELQYRPFGKGAYRKSAYYCTICNEKEKKKDKLRTAQSTFRKSLSTRTINAQLRPSSWNK